MTSGKWARRTHLTSGVNDVTVELFTFEFESLWKSVLDGGMVAVDKPILCVLDDEGGFPLSDDHEDVRRENR